MVEDLPFRITVNDQGTVKISKFGRSLKGVASRAVASAKRMTRGFKNVGLSIARLPGRLLNLRNAAIGLFAGLAIRKVIGTFVQFERQMNRVGALTGAVGQEFQRLNDLARQLGETTQFTARDAAAGMGFLAQAGFEANEIMSALPKTLQLAASAQLDLATAADITTNILTGLQLPISELGRANDVLVKAFTSTNINLQQLGESFKLVGPLATTAGIQFEEITAAIGLLGNAGIQGSLAGTSLRKAIASLLAPTSKAEKVLKRLGINARTATGQITPLRDIIAGLEKSTDIGGDAIAIFGLRAGPALAALAGQGSKALTELTAKLEDSGGIAERVAKRQMAGLTGQLLRLKSAAEGAFISIGEALAPTIGDLAESVTSVAKDLSVFLKILRDINAEADRSKDADLSGTFNETADSLTAISDTFFSIRKAIIITGIVLNKFALFSLAVIKVLNKGFASVVGFLFSIQTVGVKVMAVVLEAVGEKVAELLKLVGDAFGTLSIIAQGIPGAGGLALSLTLARQKAIDLGKTIQSEIALRTIGALALANKEERDFATDMRNRIDKISQAQNERNRSIVTQKKALANIVVEQNKISDAIARTIEERKRQAAAAKAAAELVRQEQAAAAFVTQFGVTTPGPESFQPPKIDIPKQQSIFDQLFPDEGVLKAETNLQRIRAALGRMPPFQRFITEQMLMTVKSGDDAALNSARQSVEKRMAFQRGSAQLSASLFGPNGLVSGLMAKGSKQAFEVNKAFQIGQATMGAGNAIIAALGAPFPLNLILPPVIAAAAAVQIGAIARAKPGSGSSPGIGGLGAGATSGSGALDTAEAADPAQTGPSVTVNVTAGFVGDEQKLGSEIGRIVRIARGDGVDFGGDS